MIRPGTTPPPVRRGGGGIGRGKGGGRVPVCHSMAAAATTAEPTKGATRHKLLALATRTRQTQRKDVQQQLARGQAGVGEGERAGALAGVKCLAPPRSHEPSKHGKTDAPCQPPLQVEAGRTTGHNQDKDDDEDDDGDGTWRSQCSDMQTHARTTPAPFLPLSIPSFCTHTQAVQARPELAEESIDALRTLYIHIYR